MRPISYAVLTLLVAAVGVAAVAGVTTARRGGPVKLREVGPFDEDKLVVVEFGEIVQAKASLRIDEFFGKKIVNANVRLKNTGENPMFFQVYVAFLGAEGELIGATGQGHFAEKGLPPGESTQLGSCLVPLPHAEFDKIKSYRIAWYESEKPIGKE